MSQERISKKSKVLKERIYEQSFELAHGKRIYLNMTMQVIDKGPILKPALHLFASVKHAFGTPPGQVDTPPLLFETEYGAYQMQLTTAVGARMKVMTAEELKQFQSGGYIGIGCELPIRSVLEEPGQKL